MQFFEDLRKKEIPIGFLLTGAMLAGVGVYVASLISAANNIEVRTEFDVALSGDSIIFKVRPTVVNPSNTTLSISHPNAKIYLNEADYKNGDAFGVSIPKNQNYTVIPKGTTTLEYVEIPVQYMKVPALLQLCKKEYVELYITVDTPINLSYGITPTPRKVFKEAFLVPKILRNLALMLP